MKKEETYMNLTIKQMEKLFKKLNCYGLGLLEDSVEAWQYDYYENGKLLKNAYSNAFAIREVVDRDNEKTQAVQKAILRRSLKKLTNSELEFMKSLLELDPTEVDNNFNKDSYYEINSYVIDEDNLRKYKNTKKAIKKKKLTP